jgi:lipid-A-disaccharide synthase
MAVVGISEVILKLKVLVKALRIVKRDLKKRRPCLLIVIDFPDFNFLVASAAKKLGIPVMYYISPQIWAWRTKRVKKIKRLVDHMVVIFPFEVDFYRNWDVPVTFVGHPLLDNHFQNKSRYDTFPFKEDDFVIGLLPGSRNEEINRLLPTMLQVAEKLSQDYPRARFAIPVASTVKRDLIDSAVRGRHARCVVLQDGMKAVFQNAAFIITASGTVTLEAALAGMPMIIIYKVSKLSYWIGKCLVRVEHIGLANLVAEKRIVPELIQDDVTLENITGLARRFIDDEGVLENIRKELKGVSRSLGHPGASRRAAKVAINLMQPFRGVF